VKAGHAIIGALLPEYDPVERISIVPRGATGGATFFTPNEAQLESGLYSRSYLENRMAVALGGRVAEEIILGPDQVTTGAANDFQQVFLTVVPCACAQLGVVEMQLLVTASSGVVFHPVWCRSIVSS
jgi:ATP-dependent Zn protease